ncbi:hypothetical protein KCU90_g113, partial [Aureobasidium melanogenum]
MYVVVLSRVASSMNSEMWKGRWNSRFVFQCQFCCIVLARSDIPIELDKTASDVHRDHRFVSFLGFKPVMCSIFRGVRSVFLILRSRAFPGYGGRHISTQTRDVSEKSQMTWQLWMSVDGGTCEQRGRDLMAILSCLGRDGRPAIVLHGLGCCLRLLGFTCLSSVMVPSASASTPSLSFSSPSSMRRRISYCLPSSPSFFSPFSALEAASLARFSSRAFSSASFFSRIASWRFSSISCSLAEVCLGNGAEGDVGVLASGEAAGESGFILALHLSSMSAAVGCLSGLGGLSLNPEARSAAPSPH